MATRDFDFPSCYLPVATAASSSSFESSLKSSFFLHDSTLDFVLDLAFAMQLTIYFSSLSESNFVSQFDVVAIQSSQPEAWLTAVGFMLADLLDTRVELLQIMIRNLRYFVDTTMGRSFAAMLAIEDRQCFTTWDSG